MGLMLWLLYSVVRSLTLLRRHILLERIKSSYLTHVIKLYSHISCVEYSCYCLGLGPGWSALYSICMGLQLTFCASIKLLITNKQPFNVMTYHNMQGNCVSHWLIFPKAPWRNERTNMVKRKNRSARIDTFQSKTCPSHLHIRPGIEEGRLQDQSPPPTIHPHRSGKGSKGTSKKRGWEGRVTLVVDPSLSPPSILLERIFNTYALCAVWVSESARAAPPTIHPHRSGKGSKGTSKKKKGVRGKGHPSGWPFSLTPFDIAIVIKTNRSTSRV